MTNLVRNGQLVRHTEVALRTGNESLGNVPALLRSVLSEGAWREFALPSGETVAFRRFGDFVAALPPRGLGADLPLVERITGDDVELRQMVRDAERVGRGPGPGNAPKIDGDSPSMLGNDQTGVTTERLARDHPEVYEQVRERELSVNAAAVLAGIRPRRVPVRLDRADSAARTLRAHMAPEVITELARLLVENDEVT